MGWIAGANLRVLNLVPSEWTFYNALGTLVLVLSCLSGYTMALAASYVLKTDVASVWFIGLGWFLVLINIERGILQVPVTLEGQTARWPLIGRILLSIVLGFVVSVPLVLRVNQGEIEKHIEKTQVAALQAADAKAEDFYGERIEDELTKRSEIRERVTNLQDRAGRLRERSLQVEATCGPECRRLGHQAEQIGNKLREIGPRHREQLAGIKAHIAQLREKQKSREGEGQGAIEKGGGFRDRLDALAVLSDKSTSTMLEVLFLHLFFMFLDLTPLGLKLSRVRTGSAYEEQLALELHRDRFSIAGGKADLELKEYKRDEQNRADKEVIRTEILFDTDRRINEATGSMAGRADIPPHVDPIEARGLRGYGDEVEYQEDEFVEVPPELRRAGVVGLVLIGALTALAIIWGSIANQGVTGTWLAVLALMGAGGLAAYTRGFRWAPAWALWPIFSTQFVGAILFVVIVGLNL
jgi:hypothetical protein